MADAATTKKYVILGACGIALVIASIIVFRSLFGSGGGAGAVAPSARYFVDEKTGDEVIVATRQVSPVTTSDGRVLVEAIFVSCDGGATKQLAYLVKYEPEAKEALDRVKGMASDLPVEESDRLIEQTLYREPKGTTWVKGSDPAVRRIATSPRCPNGASATVVQPPAGTSAMTIN